MLRWCFGVARSDVAPYPPGRVGATSGAGCPVAIDNPLSFGWRTTSRQPAVHALPIAAVQGCMDELQKALGVTFLDQRLLKSAFIHRSFLHEHPERTEGLPSNERLEFLGDAVLNFLTAAWLYARFPGRSEGELTALRAALVKTSTLARFARDLNLGGFIRISRGEDSPTARNRPPLLADVFEAVLGAIYLDQGIDAARSFVLPFLEREIDRVLAGDVDIDYRTRLQEVVQARYGVTPTYTLVEVTGPDHCREFTIEVRIGDERLGLGSGRSKQLAAQHAARSALAELEARSAAAS